MTKPQVVGIIPARYGSKRFPGKPLALINDKSLIRHTYENAQKCSLFDHLVVATDDQRIFDHVTKFQGEVVMTSVHCPTGTERVVEALDQLEMPDDAIVVNIQGDIPLLEPEVIEKVVSLLQDDDQIVMATAAIPITSKIEAFDPHIVKCVLDKTDHALYFSRGLIPCGDFRDDVKYYHHLGIYAYRNAFVRHYALLDSTPLQRAEDLEQLKALEHGFRIKVAIVKSASFGVDRPQDIKRVEEILCR